MKESYKKGVATHLDPESCRFRRKAELEALTGALVGWVLSSEIRLVRGADVLKPTEGNTARIANARSVPALRNRRPHARQETSCARTERPGGRPYPNRGGPVGESDER